TAALGVLGEYREVVDVGEGPVAELGQARLGGDEQADVRRRGGARGEQENTGGDEGGLPDESDVDPARGEQPVVGDLLDRGGYDEPADRRDDRDRGSDADALLHRRGEAHPFG